MDEFPWDWAPGFGPGSWIQAIVLAPMVWLFADGDVMRYTGVDDEGYPTGGVLQPGNFKPTFDTFAKILTDGVQTP